jgi:dUTP pyrophosphatase
MKSITVSPIVPQKGSAQAAAYDLAANEGADIEAFAWRVIRTGLTIEIPDGHVGLICPRSGLAAQYSITVLNAPGVIDPDFRGEIGVVLVNFSTEPFQVAPGMRIAQLLILETAAVELIAGPITSPTARGAGGFGSTG